MIVVPLTSTITPVTYKRPSFHDLTIEPTRDTPFVYHSYYRNVFVIKGNSMRPEMQHFYEPVLSLVKAEIERSRKYEIRFFYNDFNTSTAKVLFDLFKYLRGQMRAGKDLLITWIAEPSNDEMLETGKDFQELYDLPFTYKLIA